MPEAPELQILLIEDNAGDVRLIRMALQAAGFPPFALEVVADGAEVLRLLTEASEPPGLVLLDLNLPGVDADSLILALGQPHLRRVPVSILSSSRNPEDLARAGQLAHGIYLMKPSDLDEFMALGPRLLEFWRQHRPSAADAADQPTNL